MKPLLIQSLTPPVLAFGVQSNLLRTVAQGAEEAHPEPASLGCRAGTGTPASQLTVRPVSEGTFRAILSPSVKGPGLPPMGCLHPSLSPSVVGAATSCRLAWGARHESNRQLPASPGLPRPQAVAPSQPQALSCLTAARSGTPGLPPRPPALLRQHTALSLATVQPAHPGLKPHSRYWNGNGHPGFAPLRTSPAALWRPDLHRDSHLKR